MVYRACGMCLGWSMVGDVLWGLSPCLRASPVSERVPLPAVHIIQQGTFSQYGRRFFLFVSIEVPTVQLAGIRPVAGREHGEAQGAVLPPVRLHPDQYVNVAALEGNPERALNFPFVKGLRRITLHCVQVAVVGVEPELAGGTR